jgi:hypothetical protein
MWRWWTQLVAAIRRVRRLVPVAATLTLAAHDYDHAPGKPACAWDDPQARNELVSRLVNDARAVLAAGGDDDLDAEQAEAVGLLGLVAGQDVELGEQDGTFRIARTVAADRVISTVDPEARHAHKSRSVYRDGYKAHLAVEPETGLVTAATLTPANIPEPVGLQLLDGEPPGLEVLADSAYGGGQVRTALRAAGHHLTIKPIPSHAIMPGGFTKDDFAIDLQARTVTCPAGQTVRINPTGQARFGRRCQTCPLRPLCTTASRGRTVLVYRWEAELQAAATTPLALGSRPVTGGGGRWWNARSFGWSLVVTGGSATAASLATSSACRCGSPRSPPPAAPTWPHTRQHRLGARLRQVAGPGCQCGTSLRRKPSSVAGSHPQHRRFGSDISRAHRSLRPPSPTRKMPCSAGS